MRSPPCWGLTRTSRPPTSACFPGGTAYLTDVGMTGPHDGVIGMERAGAVARFLTGIPSRFDPATGEPRLHGAVITADPATGRATGIRAFINDARGPRVSSLFDLPFEEPVEPTRAPAAGGTSASRPYDPDRLGADRESSGSPRNHVSRDLGRRRALQREGLDDRPPVLHVERRLVTDQGRDVPLGAPLSEIQT